MATPATRLPARVREDHAKRAGAEAQRILTTAERTILAGMSAAAGKVAAGTLTPQLAKRKVRVTTSTALGAASARLQAVYGTAVKQVTGETGPLPDAPGQVATAILRAQADADVAFGAVLAATGADGSRTPPPSSPYRKITDKAQRGNNPAGLAVAAVAERSLTGWTSYAGRRYPLATYGAKVVKAATVKLARMPVMSEITARRDQLLAQHTAAVTAAWAATTAHLDASALVSAFNSDTRLASTASPDLAQRWRAEAAQAAASAWISDIGQTADYAALTALTAALEGMIGDGMAEGQADAMTIAAQHQGLGRLDTAAAFTAALGQFQGSMGVTRQARDTAARITATVSAGVARALTAAEGDGEAEGAAREAAAGGKAVSRWADYALWAAFGAGAVALYQRVAAGMFTGQGLMISWLDSASACPLCQQNAAGSPYAPADVPAYPGHNSCRCFLASDSDIPASMLAQFVGLDI